jgi:hypothetical protein
MRNVLDNLMVKPFGKKPLETPGLRLKNSFMIYLEEKHGRFCNDLLKCDQQMQTLC